MEASTLNRKSRTHHSAIFQKRPAQSREKALTKIHKVYLIVALVLSFTLAIGLPLFSEPDGQIHFVSSAKIVGIIPDLSQVGETADTGGLEAQRASYQDGTHFKKYYLTRVQLMRASQLPVSPDISVTDYGFWGHLVPAVGVWIGYHIYPSVGVMVTVARMFSAFVYSLLMYFIIRYVKRSQLFFVALMLSPVVVNQFASLSYDALSFVLVALAVAISINALEEKKLSSQRLAAMGLVTLFTLLAAKTNFKLVLILFPLVIIRLLMRDKRLSRVQTAIVAGGVTGVIVLVIAFLTLPYGGLFDFASRLFTTFVNNPATWVENQVPHNFMSTFVAPYPRYNFMPVWLTGVWVALLAVVCLSEEQYDSGSLMVWGVLGIFVVNLLSIYHAFLGFKSSFVLGVGSANAILGVQGRYTTPLYLLAVFVPAAGRFNLRFSKPRGLLVAVIVVAILSSLLLLFNTLYGVIFLKA